MTLQYFFIGGEVICTELINLLTSYLLGWKTLYDCAEWLASIDWDNTDLDRESVELIGRMELLTTEVAEGLRPEAEFWQEVAELVARETNSFYIRQASTTDLMVASSANNIT